MTEDKKITERSNGIENKQCRELKKTKSGFRKKRLLKEFNKTNQEGQKSFTNNIRNQIGNITKEN